MVSCRRRSIARIISRASALKARRAIGALHDEDLPGPHRLEYLAADFSRDSHIQAALEVTGTPRQLDSQRSLTLFRVAQEALTNSLKHSRPQRVDLLLAYESDGTRLVIEDHSERDPARTVTPDGLSQSEGGIAGGYGLIGMSERAELLGGRLHAAPTSDGFKVELWIPA
jgi:signal transduction histidine kinase